jgi:hypothetical protein
MSITNLETGETLQVQHNPTELEVAMEAVYNRVSGPGASFQEMQFTNTGNLNIPTVDLPFDGRAANSPDLDSVQGFALSLHAPPDEPLGVKNGSPPRVLFRWPGWIALEMRGLKITIKARRFSADGPPTYINLKLNFEEARITRLGTESVRRSVLRRSA